MTRPSAAPAYFPYTDHRTIEQVVRDEEQGALSPITVLKWWKNEPRICKIQNGPMSVCDTTPGLNIKPNEEAPCL